MKIKKTRARCRRVLAVLNNQLVILELLREETWPPAGDFDADPLEFAVVRYKNLTVHVPLETVVFLNGPRSGLRLAGKVLSSIGEGPGPD